MRQAVIEGCASCLPVRCSKLLNLKYFEIHLAYFFAKLIAISDSILLSDNLLHKCSGVLLCLELPGLIGAWVWLV